MIDDTNFTDDPEDGTSLNEFHPYYCTFCGEENEFFVDATPFQMGSRRQQFTEDCAVCCRPNLITITMEKDGFLSIEVEREYDA